MLKSGGAPINILRFIRGSSKEVQNDLAGKLISSDMGQEAESICGSYFDLELSKPSFISFLKLFCLVLARDYSVLHTNGKSGVFYGLLLYPICLIKKIKICHTFRGFYLPVGKSRLIHFVLEFVYLKLIKSAIAVSKSEREKVGRYFPWALSKVDVIPNGVVVKRRELKDFERSILDKNRINIVSLSRLSYQKDILLMLDSFDIVAGQKEGVALHIIGGSMPGDKAYVDRVSAKIKDLKHPDKVFLWGDVESASGILHHFDGYFSTSIFEGLPTAIIEAGLVGLPIVATNCTGNIDLINSETGYLVESRDPKVISQVLDKVVDAIGTGFLDSKIGAMRVLSENFSVKNNVFSLLKVYKN